MTERVQFVELIGPRQDTGFVLVGTAASESPGAVAWSNPGNVAIAGDATFASLVLPKNNLTQRLRGSSLGLAVPANTVILGIEVRARLRRASTGTVAIDEVLLRKGGVAVGSDRAAGQLLTESFANYDFGGAGDLWGTTWTPADVNDASFGAFLALLNNSTFTESTDTFDSGSAANTAVPANASAVTIKGWGRGAAGGGSTFHASEPTNPGGGGGGGGYSERLVRLSADAGKNVTRTVAVPGGATITTIDATLTNHTVNMDCNDSGVGGTGTTSGPGSGGAGGTASGGTTNTTGTSGAAGSDPTGGAGGGAAGGGGGGGAGGGAAANGTGGTAPGGGGGGGGRANIGGPSTTGGAGTAGRVQYLWSADTPVECADVWVKVHYARMVRFGRAQYLPPGIGTVIGAVESISTRAAQVNLAGMNDSISAFGMRERVTIKMVDFAGSVKDLTGDSGAQDSAAAGTFWGKWLARNPYYTNYRVRVREGVYGDAIEAMSVRTYVLDQVDGPTNGMVTLVAKDLFSLVEARKAKAPKASRGALSANLASGTTSTFAIVPTGIGDADYPTGTFRVRINDEVIQVSRTAGSETLTIIARGNLNTVAASHTADDTVQLVLAYEAQRAAAIVYDLLTVYTAILKDDINKTAWDAEAATFFPQLYTGYVTEPTEVEHLVGELAQQAFFTIWPEVDTGQIRMRAITGSVGTEIVDDDAWIAEKSLVKKVQEERRLSQVHVYYGRKNPVPALDEKKNYSVRLVVSDVTAEAAGQYGSAAIKEIFSRWITATAVDSADFCGQRVLSMFRDPPAEASFELSKSRSNLLALSEPFRLKTNDLQDALGAPTTIVMYPTQVERKDLSEVITAQQVRFAIPIDDTKDLVIAEDTNNFDFRAAFESIFGAPQTSDVVKCTIVAGVVVGSSSPSTPAFDTGTWPAMSTAPLIINNGRIAGAGGAGGNGGGRNQNGAPGTAGGLALKVRSAMTINNGSGVVAGGGGGGGGGGGDDDLIPAGSGGGGGGAGRDGGAGGAPGGTFPAGQPGQTGSVTSGGAGGASGSGNAGDGGAGGGPAVAGTVGQNGDGGSGGAGGGAGGAVDGDSLVTWSPLGTVTGTRTG